MAKKKTTHRNIKKGGMEMAVGKPKDNRIYAVVPEGLKAGDEFETLTPTGQPMTVVVPSGATSGTYFPVTIPSSLNNETESGKNMVKGKVTVPEGAKPGDIVQSRTPGGKEFYVVVPNGYTAGETFNVTVEEVEPPSDPPESSPFPPSSDVPNQQLTITQLKEELDKGKIINVQYTGKEDKSIVTTNGDFIIKNGMMGKLSKDRVHKKYEETHMSVVFLDNIKTALNREEFKVIKVVQKEEEKQENKEEKQNKIHNLPEGGKKTKRRKSKKTKRRKTKRRKFSK